MRVLFIKPPNVGFYHEIERFYPVGLAYLAAACRKAGHTVKIFDSLTYVEDNCVLSYEELSPGQKVKVDHHPSWSHMVHWGAGLKRIRAIVNEFSPDIVSVTALHTPMYDTAYQVIDLVKTNFPDIITIMGGPHASILCDHVMERSKTDYVLIGEGEKSIVQLLDCLQKGVIPYNVPGVVFRETNSEMANDTTTNGLLLYRNYNVIWECNLDQLEFPAADLLDLSKYYCVTLITSRGCPNRCSFCTVHPTMGRVYRSRSPENVIKEIKWYVNEFGVKKFNIEDDNFTYDKERAEKILDLIIKNQLNIEINFPNGITAINIDDRLVGKMCAAGYKESFIGLETTSKERLKKINKGFTSLELVNNVQKMFRKHGQEIGASLVIGFPDQTIKEMIDDITNLMKLNITFGTANPCYPIPQSELYNECIDSGLIHEEMDFTWFDEFNFPLETSNFSRKDIYDIWVCSLSFDYYPKVFDSLRKGHSTIHHLIEIFKEYDYGVISINEGNLVFRLNSKDIFSTKMLLKPGASHANLYVDTLNGDVISTISYFFTGVAYRADQEQSKLSSLESEDVFVLKKCENKDMTMQENFIKTLLR